jgi:GNAT superfamily N-acetyltransferase
VGRIEVRAVRYDDPQVVELTALVQAEYERRYGSPGGDTSPIDAEQFVPPNGQFFLLLVDGRAAGMGGWRWGGPQRGDVELKRMFVLEPFRRQGLSRRLFGAIEADVRTQQAKRLVLETGVEQPEAIGLYGSVGVEQIEPFGHYADAADAVHLGKQLA